MSFWTTDWSGMICKLIRKWWALRTQSGFYLTSVSYDTEFPVLCCNAWLVIRWHLTCPEHIPMARKSPNFWQNAPAFKQQDLFLQEQTGAKGWYSWCLKSCCSHSVKPVSPTSIHSHLPLKLHDTDGTLQGPAAAAGAILPKGYMSSQTKTFTHKSFKHLQACENPSKPTCYLIVSKINYFPVTNCEQSVIMISHH